MRPVYCVTHYYFLLLFREVDCVGVRSVNIRLSGIHERLQSMSHSDGTKVYYARLFYSVLRDDGFLNFMKGVDKIITFPSSCTWFTIIRRSQRHHYGFLVNEILIRHHHNNNNHPHPLRFTVITRQDILGLAWD